ncbi:hypothetical protein MMC13_000157 [Lambiella insularis]|nr:hypothetical protein [Lambiella insularis]
MADPFSITLGVIQICQEVYTVGKYIYETVISAKDCDAERKEIVAKINHELIILAAFERWVSKANGALVDDELINEGILLDTIHICERFRDDFADYARLARVGYSPWNDQRTAANREIEPDTKQGRHEAAKPSALSKMRSKAEDIRVASRWALFDKKKLEALVIRFRERNGQLSGTLQIASAFQSRMQNQNDWGNKALEVLREDSDAKVLGIAARAERAILAMDSSSSKINFSIENGILEATSETSTLHIGTLRVSGVSSRTTTNMVLVEFKSYSNSSRGNALEQDGSANAAASSSPLSRPAGRPTGNKVVPEQNKQIEAAQAKTRATIISRVNQLASILNTSGLNRLGTLPFKGLIHQVEHNRHAFIFEFPEDAEQTQPVSLHSMIESRRSVSLSTRFKIAETLAQTLGKFHADGWIHKAISSESVAFFKDCDDDPKKQDVFSNIPYLVNFEYSRPDEASSVMAAYRGDVDLYLHPELQGPFRPAYSKSHDLYSLGVVLLEIAVSQTARAMIDQSHRDRKRAGETDPMNAHDINKFYCWYAKRRVAHHMGEAYLNAVMLCLESRFKEKTGRADFATIFNRDVIQKLSPRTLI